MYNRNDKYIKTIFVSLSQTWTLCKRNNVKIILLIIICPPIITIFLVFGSNFTKKDITKIYGHIPHKYTFVHVNIRLYTFTYIPTR